MVQQLDHAKAVAVPPLPGRSAYPPKLVAATVLVDIAALTAGSIVAALLKPPLPQHLLVLAATIPAWPLVFAANGLYDHRRLVAGWREARRVFNAVSLGMFGIILAFFLGKESDLSRGWVVLAWPSCLVAVTGARLALRKAVHAMRNRGRLRSPVVIVGLNEEARQIARMLTRNRWLGYQPVGFVGVSNGDPTKEIEDGALDGLPVLGWTRHMAEAVRRAHASGVVVASSAVAPEKLASVYWALQEQDVEVRISAGVLNIAASRMIVEPLDGMPVLSLRPIQLPRWQAAVKRGFDVVVASGIILFLAPLLLGIAAAVRRTSEGPAIFRQIRTGQSGRPFRMMKFRTMVQDAEARRNDLVVENEADGPLFKIKDDPRITRVGAFLRRWSLDELPQLFNVLRGEMSLVGPRPLPIEDSKNDPWLLARMRVKPGITGLWQVNGRHELTLDDFVRYELFYARNWSVALDLSILWRTIPAVLSRRGSF